MSKLTKVQVKQLRGFMYVMDQIVEKQNELGEIRSVFIHRIEDHDCVTICEKTVERLFRLRDVLDENTESEEIISDCVHHPSIRTLNQMVRFLGDSKDFTFKDVIEDNEEEIELKYDLNQLKETFEKEFGKRNSDVFYYEQAKKAFEKIKDKANREKLVASLVTEKPAEVLKEYPHLVNKLYDQNIMIIGYLKFLTGLSAMLLLHDIQDIVVEVSNLIDMLDTNVENSNYSVEEEIKIKEKENKKLIPVKS